MKKIFFLVLVLFLSAPVLALNTQNIRHYFPHSRAVTIVESQPKPKDTLSLGFGFNFALQPIEFGTSAGGGRIQGIVDSLFSFDFGAGYSVTDLVSLSINVPMHITNNIRSLSNFNNETVVSFGDIQFAGLWNILTREDSSVGFGLSVVPFLSIPSGASGNFVGDSHLTGGAMAAADMDYNEHYVGLNFGFRLREEENFLGLSIGQEMLYRLAYSHYIVQSYDLYGLAEVGGSITLNGIESNSSPFEILVGASKRLSDVTPLTIKIANGFGLGNGYGTPDYRALLHVSYDYDLPGRQKRVEKPIYMDKVEKRLKELTIYYPTDGAQVDPFYEEKISGIAEIMQENPGLGPIYIVGHTDDVGSEAYNQELSERRAKQAYQSIVTHEIPQERIVYYGVGETYPVAPNVNDKNRSLNRRTLFTFVKPTEETLSSSDYVKGATDSYTETLKVKKERNEPLEGEYYKEEKKVEKVRVDTEEVYVDEEGRESKEKKKRRRFKEETKNSQPTSQDDGLQEKDLKTAEDPDFEEGFSEY